jgi:hypothetical protein
MISLRLSLAANLVLAALVLALWLHESPPAPALAAPRSAPVPPPAPVSPVTDVLPASPASELAPAPRETSEALSAIEQLEALGFSRELLVNGLRDQLNRRTEARLVALQKKHAPNPVPEAELRALARQSTVDERRELRAALGEAGYRAWDKEQALQALNRARPPGDPLPMSDQESEHAYRLQKQFDDEYVGLQEAMEDGTADAADVGRLQALAQQKLDRELSLLLGPARLAALRGSAAPLAAGGTR